MEVQNLHDLIEAGIKLHRNDLPKGFIVCFKVSKEAREQIYSDIIDKTQICPTYNKDSEYYSFTIIGIKYHLY